MRRVENNWRRARLISRERPPVPVKARRVEEDALSRMEYGERTWTSAQTVRDIMQNHLDANTDRFFCELMDVVIDESKVDIDTLDEWDVRTLNNLSYLVFIYRKYFADADQSVQQRVLEQIREHSVMVADYVHDDLLRESLDKPEDREIDPTSLVERIEPITEAVPDVEYCVVDVTTPETKCTWVSYELIQQPPYTDVQAEGEQEAAPTFRYQIESMKVGDQGPGFDVQLTAFYKSTKRDKRHLRGKFGEGSKMCYLHLLRNNARAKLRSSYMINGEVAQPDAPQMRRVWQGRPVDEEGIMKIHGVEIEREDQGDLESGTCSVISIKKADPAFREEFTRNIDPRIERQGMGSNCVEFSDQPFHYELSSRFLWDPAENEYFAVGVSLGRDPSEQYVQGLRVDYQKEEGRGGQPLFSYDVANGYYIGGRDRNVSKGEEVDRAIASCWRYIQDPELLTALVQRVTNHDERMSRPPEAQTLDGLLKNACTAEQAEPHHEALLRIFPEAIGLQRGCRNVIITTDSLGRYHKEVEIAQRNGFNIAVVRRDIGHEALKAVVDYYQEHEGMEIYSIFRFREEMAELNLENPTDPELEQVAREFYCEAVAELQELLGHIGWSTAQLRITEDPKIIATASEYDYDPVELRWSEDEERFQVIVKPESMFLYRDDDVPLAVQLRAQKKYWKRRVEVALLGTLNRETEISEDRGIAAIAQRQADRILKQSLDSNMDVVACIPEGFDHELSSADVLGEVDPWAERLRSADEIQYAWAQVKMLRTVGTPFEDLRRIAQESQDYPPPIDEVARREAKDKIIVRDGRVGFFIRGSNTLAFYAVSLEFVDRVDDAPNGQAIYQLGEAYFSVFDVPEGSIVEVGSDKNNRFIRYRGEIHSLNSDDVIEPQEAGKVTIQEGCITLSPQRYGKRHDTTPQDLIDAVDQCRVVPPEKKKSREMEFTAGEVPTPIAIEHGIDQWDNPVRLIQDVIQNHLDADRQGTRIHLEVIRDGARTWVVTEEVFPDDDIVDIRFSDNGS